MNQLYGVLGISKQAIYQQSKRQISYDQQVLGLAVQVSEWRKAHPGCGVEKMYYALRPSFMGRDKFVSLFMDMGYRLKRKVNYKRTTVRGRIRHPNCIKGLQISGPSQVWQSDITYIRVKEKDCYGVFILDVYTKKIVGYKVSGHMFASANGEAFKMALKDHLPPLIHHSDQGSQYGSKQYLALLEANNCKVSMSTSGPDNAYAERINRTIKEEYLDHQKIRSLKHLKTLVRKAVDNYNRLRPHRSLAMLSPVNFEIRYKSLPLQQRPVITIFNNQKNL